MKTERKTISPSEINKFVYCNYQWYYHKKYGGAKLRQLRKAFLADRGLPTDIPADRHLRLGRKFHAGFGRRPFVAALRIALALAAVAAIVYFLISSGVFAL